MSTNSSEPVAPAVCYPFCSNAFREAESIGQSPELCNPGSQFQAEYASCQLCIAENPEDVGGPEGLEFIRQVMGRFLEYCDLLAITRTESFTLANGVVTVIEYLDVGGPVTTTEKSSNSIFTSSPTETAARARETSSVPSPSTSTEPEPEQGGSKAWIAGAVVGPLLLIFLALCIYWLRRRRQRSASLPAEPAPSSPTMEKAQLHSDSISPYKFAQEADSGYVHELDASPRPGEFPAKETPAHKLPDKSHRRDG